MIDIYTEKKDSKDWIIKNDLFFNLNTSNEEMSDNEVALIKQIDDAKLTPDKHIETKYGLEDLKQTEEYNAIKLFNYKSEDVLEKLKQCRNNFVVIDNADILMDDEVRQFINFEFSNQYMLFLRNCDGLNVSDKSFKVMKFEGNMITLEEEL